MPRFKARKGQQIQPPRSVVTKPGEARALGLPVASTRRTSGIPAGAVQCKLGSPASYRLELRNKLDTVLPSLLARGARVPYTSLRCAVQ